MGKFDEKIATYEDYIENKLKRDLKGVETLLDKKAKDYENWQGLQNFIRHAKKQKEEDEILTSFEFGLGVHLFARLEQLDKIIVCIGCNCYLEMYYDEAEKYVELRMKFLHREIEFLRERAVYVKAHIKLMLLAINECKTYS